MNTNNLEKCDVYSQGLVWFKIYTFVYIYAFIVIKMALLFHAVSSETYWEGLRIFFLKKSATIPLIDFIGTILMLIIAISNAVFLPMVGMSAYRTTFAHIFSLIAFRPCILLLQLILLNKINAQDIKIAIFIYPITVIFAVINIAYFSKRKDLFENDLTVLVTGKEKDMTKH